VGKQSRDKSREMRRAKAAMAEQRRGRRRWAFTAGMVIVVALLMAIVGSLIWAAGNDDDSTGTATGDLVTPKGATAAGALVSGETGAVRLEIFLDYMCPYCGRFERANGDEIERLVGDGTVRLELYPLSFLDRMSDGAQYSTRAANSVTTVADRAPEQLLPFNEVLFANQPQEGSKGLTDGQIATMASGVGVPADVVEAFDDRIFEPWVAASTEKVFDSGITGTPTVKINGEVFKGDLYTVGPLTEAIMEAKGK